MTTYNESIGYNEPIGYNGAVIVFVPVTAPLQWQLNRLAGTTGMDAQGAANVWAGTTGLDMVGALNYKAGITNRAEMKALLGILNQLAGTTGLGQDAAAALIES